jgi:dolichol-phosphate mannosyltransferase
LRKKSANRGAFFVFNHEELTTLPSFRTLEGMNLSVVIPCYNEEESLRETHRRVKAACDAVHIGSYEIILVNDGSKDGTLSIMKDLLTSDPCLVIVDLSRNHGHQLALTAGLSHAKGDYIFILDADLQDPPELLGAMLARAKAGVDVVYGKREVREGESAFKLATADAFYNVLSYLSDIPIPKDVGDFRLITRRVVDQFLAMPEQHRFIRGMIAWIGYTQEAFPYKRDPRFAGVTKYPLHKLLHFAVDAISSFSIKPLRISMLFALFGAGFAGLLGLYVVGIYFLKGTVVGWASIASIMAFFSSLQLICIGVIGEYVGRTYMQVKNRPLFIVRAVHRGTDRVG